MAMATRSRISIASVLDPLLVHALSYLYHGDFIGAMCSCHRLLSLCRTPRLWRSLNLYKHSHHHRRSQHQHYDNMNHDSKHGSGSSDGSDGYQTLSDAQVSRWLTTTIQPARQPAASSLTDIDLSIAMSGRFAYLRELHLHHSPSVDQLWSDSCDTLTALGSLPSLTTLYMGSGASLWNRKQFESLLGAAPNLLHLSIPMRLIGPALWGPRPKRLVTFDARYMGFGMAEFAVNRGTIDSANFVTHICISFPKLRAITLPVGKQCDLQQLKPIAHQLTSLDLLINMDNELDHAVLRDMPQLTRFSHESVVNFAMIATNLVHPERMRVLQIRSFRDPIAWTQVKPFLLSLAVIEVLCWPELHELWRLPSSLVSLDTPNYSGQPLTKDDDYLRALLDPLQYPHLERLALANFDSTRHYYLPDPNDNNNTTDGNGNANGNDGDNNDGNDGHDDGGDDDDGAATTEEIPNDPSNADDGAVDGKGNGDGDGSDNDDTKTNNDDDNTSGENTDKDDNNNDNDNDDYDDDKITARLYAHQRDVMDRFMARYPFAPTYPKGYRDPPLPRHNNSYRSSWRDNLQLPLPCDPFSRSHRHRRRQPYDHEHKHEAMRTSAGAGMRVLDLSPWYISVSDWLVIINRHSATLQRVDLRLEPRHITPVLSTIFGQCRQLRRMEVVIVPTTKIAPLSIYGASSSNNDKEAITNEHKGVVVASSSSSAPVLAHPIRLTSLDIIMDAPWCGRAYERTTYDLHTLVAKYLNGRVAPHLRHVQLDLNPLNDMSSYLPPTHPCSAVGLLNAFEPVSYHTTLGVNNMRQVDCAAWTKIKRHYDHRALRAAGLPDFGYIAADDDDNEHNWRGERHAPNEESNHEFLYP